MRPWSALKVQSLPHAGLPQKQVSAQCTGFAIASGGVRFVSDPVKNRSETVSYRAQNRSETRVGDKTGHNAQSEAKSEAIEQDPVWFLVKYCSMVPFLINGSGAVRGTPLRSKYRCPSVRITGSRSAGSAASATGMVCLFVCLFVHGLRKP